MTRYSLDNENQTLRIEVDGDLLSTNFEKVNAQIHAALDDEQIRQSGWSLLLFDLSAARMIDSMGLNVIVGLIKKVQGRSAKIRTRITSQTIHRTFLFTRLEKYMEVEFVGKN